MLTLKVSNCEKYKKSDELIIKTKHENLAIISKQPHKFRLYSEIESFTEVEVFNVSDTPITFMKDEVFGKFLVNRIHVRIEDYVALVLTFSDGFVVRFLPPECHLRSMGIWILSQSNVYSRCVS